MKRNYISKYLKGLHESLGTRFRDGSKVIDQVSLGHSNSCVQNGQGFVSFVWSDLDEQLLARIELRWLSEGLITNLVKSIGGVGDQFSEEDFFVAKKRS